jgi:tetratricopeptide (TPR) repeat protein
VAIAAFGRAVSLEALGQLDEAMQAYQEVTLRHSTSSVAGQARLAVAGLHERRGELERALAVLRELSGRLDSTWASAAQVAQESLLLRHPELAPAPSPMVAPVPASAPGDHGADARSRRKLGYTAAMMLCIAGDCRSIGD